MIAEAKAKMVAAMLPAALAALPPEVAACLSVALDFAAVADHVGPLPLPPERAAVLQQIADASGVPSALLQALVAAVARENASAAHQLVRELPDVGRRLGEARSGYHAGWATAVSNEVARWVPVASEVVTRRVTSDVIGAAVLIMVRELDPDRVRTLRGLLP